MRLNYLNYFVVYKQHYLIGLKHKFRITHFNTSFFIDSRRKIGTYFESNENEFAHSTLLEFPQYSKTMIDYKILQSKKNVPTQFSINEDLNKLNKIFFLTLSKYTENDNLQNNSIDKVNMKNYKQISDEDLLILMMNFISFIRTDPSLLKNHKNILQYFRKQSIMRMKYWNTDQILLMADIFYCIKFDFTYIYLAIKYFEDKLETLTSSQFVQLCFYLNIIRKNELQQSLEPFINKYLDHLNIEELGIIAMALFKTRSSIKNITLIENMVKKLDNNIETISDISLCSLLKCIRLNFEEFHPKYLEICMSILRLVQPHLKRLSSFCLVQIASFGNKFCIYDKEIISEILDILYPLISKIRLKDIERLTYVIMNSNMNLSICSNYPEIIEQELKNKLRYEDIRQYQFSALSTVYYLICMNYKVDNLLIEDILNLNFNCDIPVQNLNKYDRDYQLLNLDTYLSLERSNNYQGFRIPTDYKTKLVRKYLPRIPDESLVDLTRQESNILLVKKLLQVIINKENMHITCVLPHIPFLGIVFCTDNSGKPMIIPDKFLEYLYEDIKYPVHADKLTWNIIILSNLTSYFFNTFDLKGEFKVKVRQLKKIGYRVVIVSYRDLNPPKNLDKIKHLSQALTISSLHPSILEN